MDLTTLGAALKFAIDLETKAMKVYEDAAQSIADTERRNALVALLASNNKRKTMLQDLYNDNVYSDQDTGIFEPIPSLKGDDYLVELSATDRNNWTDILALGMKMEEKTASFYSDLAGHLRYQRRGVARRLDKMAQENRDRRLELGSHYDKVVDAERRTE